MSAEEENRILSFLRENQIIRPRDLKEINVDRYYFYQLVDEGKIRKIRRGLYTLPDTEFSEFRDFAEVSKHQPESVICLLSALQFHEITSQSPADVWIAIRHKDRPPKINNIPLRVTRMSGKAFEMGIEVHDIDSVPVQIYSLEKTIADCFKFRNKIGKGVSIEALNDFIRNDRGSLDTLWRYAKICRVQSLMRPYLEAFTI